MELNQKKVLVTGANGMLGRKICEALQKSYQVYGTDIYFDNEQLQYQTILGDLTDSEFVDKLLKKIQPEIIVNCAALVNLNTCQEYPEKANLLHIDATKQLASFAAKFIYISTDSVFDGTIERGYIETDKTNPINYYSKSKLYGEQAALLANSRALILRANIYGFKPNGTSLAEWAINQLKQNNNITGFDDIIFNPLYIGQLADVVGSFLNNQNDICGVYHTGVVNKLSKYEFVVKLAKKLDLPHDLIKKGSSTDINFIAPRPLNTALNTEKMQIRIAKKYTIEDGLLQFVEDYKKAYKGNYR